MRLERFNRYGSFIDFDPDKGVAVEASAAGAGRKPVGVGDLLDDTPVAMTCVRFKNKEN